MKQFKTMKRFNTAGAVKDIELMEKIKKPGFIIDIRYSREEVPETAPQKYEKNY